MEYITKEEYERILGETKRRKRNEIKSLTEDLKKAIEQNEGFENYSTLVCVSPETKNENEKAIKEICIKLADELNNYKGILSLSEETKNLTKADTVFYIDDEKNLMYKPRRIEVEECCKGAGTVTA